MQAIDKGIDLWISENSNGTLPGSPSCFLFLLTYLLSNADHKARLQFYNFIAAVLGDNFITTFLLSPFRIIYELFFRLMLLNEIEIILGLPSTRAEFKKKVSVVAPELPVCSFGQITE